MILEINKDNLEGLQEDFRAGLLKETNFDFFITDGIADYTQADLDRYQQKLFVIAEAIIANYRRDKKAIAVNVLTDIFTLLPSIVDDYFLFCRNCPCWQCIPNRDLFKQTTGDEYIPPWQYCEKAFLEMDVSRHIVETLHLPVELPDINRRDLYELTNLLYGSKIRSENDL